MRYDTIIWDFNGTLVDDVNIACKITNEMLSKRKKQPITLNMYRSFMDTPILHFYQQAFDMNREDLTLLTDEFHRSYLEYEDEIPLGNGVKSLLVEMNDIGTTNIVLSSSKELEIRELLHRRQVLSFFSNIYGAKDNLSESKINRAVKYVHQLNVSSRILVIGDCLHDYYVSRAIEADCVLVTYGHQSVEKLISFGVPLLNSIKELSTLLHTI